MFVEKARPLFTVEADQSIKLPSVSIGEYNERHRFHVVRERHLQRGVIK